jgi:uncharacterized protein (DUF4415 family)
MKKKWVDPDDAPPLTGEELKRPNARWRIGGKVVPPEAGREAFSVALRGSKTRINIHIDDDVIDFFKKKAGPRGYQTLINSALRLVMLDETSISGSEQSNEVLREQLRSLNEQLANIQQQIEALASKSSGSWRVESPAPPMPPSVGGNVLRGQTVRYNS